MMITVDIAPEVHAELARQAVRRGRALETYVADLLKQAAPVSAAAPTAKAPAKDMVELFAPLRGLDIDFERDRDPGRDIEMAPTFGDGFDDGENAAHKPGPQLDVKPSLQTCSLLANGEEVDAFADFAESHYAQEKIFLSGLSMGCWYGPGIPSQNDVPAWPPPQESKVSSWRSWTA